MKLNSETAKKLGDRIKSLLRYIGAFDTAVSEDTLFSEFAHDKNLESILEMLIAADLIVEEFQGYERGFRLKSL